MLQWWSPACFKTPVFRAGFALIFSWGEGVVSTCDASEAYGEVLLCHLSLRPAAVQACGALSRRLH